MLKRWIAIVLCVVLLVVGVSAGVAQDATPVAPTLADQMTVLEQITQTLRHLSAKTPVEHRFPTRQETIDYLRDTYDRELPPEEFDRLKLFYVALGLLPADTDLREVYLSLLDSQVAGFYDPDTKTMNVIPTGSDDVGKDMSLTEQVIYVHEFTHALQDQYFDLNKLAPPEIQDTPDRSLAVTALVEGDATAIMNLYTQEVSTRNPLAALSLLVEGMRAGNLSLPEGIPPVLVNELLFPYEGGMDFILALYKSGGWDAVNGAFENPPTSTEQILHPDKYLSGEGGEDVFLPDASAALGEGWSSAWDSPLGEYYLRESLATELSASDAAKAAAGWGGDHFRIYQNGDQIAWALRSAWDSFDEAQEFKDLLAQYGDARFGTSADDDGCWSDDDAALCLLNVTAGPESYIVSAPTIEQAKALAGM